MAGKDDEATPPGWYRQHDDPGTLRWWDGEDWTDDTMAAPPEGSPAPAPIVPSVGEAPARSGPAHAVARPAPQAGSLVPPGRASQGQKPPARRSQAGSSRARAPQGRTSPGRAPQGQAPRSRTSQPGAPQSRAPQAPKPAPRGTGPRPPQRMAGGSAARRSAGAPRTGARSVQSERVVRRRPTGPSPAVRVALRAALLAVVVGILYLGYVQLRDAEAPDARTVTEEPAEAPDERFRPVAEALLTLEDLPGGWVAQAHDPGVDDICEGRVPRSVIVPEDVGSAAFTQGASGPFLTSVVARFQDEDAARQFVDLTERVVESCRAYEANGANVRLGPLDYPRFGDDTFVAAASGDSQFGAITGRIVYVRVGSLVVSVETIAFGETQVADELVEHLANLLAKRLRAL